MALLLPGLLPARQAQAAVNRMPKDSERASPSGPAPATASLNSISLTLDGVQLVVHSAYLPSNTFVLPQPGAGDQIASSTAWKPFRELSITAIPFGRKSGTEDLPAASSGGQRGYQVALRAYRIRQGAKVQDGPIAVLFGKSIAGAQSIVKLYVDGPVQKPIVIDEWVVEAGSRLWIVRASQEQTGSEPGPSSPEAAQGLSVDSHNLDAATTIGNPPGEAPRQGWLSNATGNLPTPSWWNGDCDYNNYLAKAGIGSYRLGAVYLGLPACGPRPWADGAPDVLVRFFSGAWGENEWECVELTMRFLYLMYGIPPYSANGSQVVWNYSGSRLIKVANGAVGQAPQPNDVLSYGATTTFGHASVVMASSVDANGNGTITVIEQNSSASGSSTLSVSSWYVNGNAGSVSGWLHDATATNGNITVSIGGVETGAYAVPSGGRVTPTFGGVINGPVEVKDDANFFTSERVIKGPYSMFNEVMGYPANQLTNDYWFPSYDNVSMTSWVLVGNPSATAAAHVTITIAGSPVGTYTVGPLSNVTPTFEGVANGPVEVSSDINVFASERVMQGPYNSFNEFIGLPASRLTNDYWFPWYDDVNMATTLAIGNPGTSATAHVTVKIASSSYGPYPVFPYSRFTLVVPGVMDGPVEVSSDTNIVTSEQVLKGPYNSFNEVMGYPNNQLTNDYWFPWYDDVNMTTWILVGNPSASATAHATIKIAGNSFGPYSIGPYDRITPTFPGVMNGPVEVTSDINVFASERVMKGPYNSFNEVMGFPGNQLTNDYWFPWYDNVNMTTWVLAGRP